VGPAVGGSIAGLAALIIIVFAVAFLKRRRRNRRVQQERKLEEPTLIVPFDIKHISHFSEQSQLEDEVPSPQETCITSEQTEKLPSDGAPQ
jgi:hypothetical protein